MSKAKRSFNLQAVENDATSAFAWYLSPMVSSNKVFERLDLNLTLFIIENFSLCRHIRIVQLPRLSLLKS